MIAFSPKPVMLPPIIETIRRSVWLIRSVGSLVIISFLGALLAPTAVAAQNWREQRAIETGKPDELSSTLQTVESLLQQLSEPGSVGMARSKADKTQLKSQLGELEANLERLDQGVLADFDGVKQWLKEQHLPATILNRHEQTVAAYRQEMKALRKNLGAVRAAKKDNALVQAAGTALNQLKQHRNKRSHQPLDPQNLPFSVADGKTRKPHTTPEALNDLLFPPVKAAKNTKAAKTVIKQGRTAPTADDLAETIEVQFTQPIQDLATQLERNPVKIYNWVHNNIEFIPTYGSIQGADMTLQTKHGNAFDTASLLIALLRASGIHARYAYGTVEIPIEKVMNWVGGTTSPEAALQLLGQGGIPNVGLTQGGKFIAAQLEHVWVEAWVDFAPSRGAKHKTGDSWIPLDASFKQYEFTAGMNLEQTVPFDAENFANTLTQTAQINEAEGWVQGIDQNTIQTTLQTYQSQIETYIAQTKPDATVGDVLGRQRIIQRDAPILATGLPYAKVLNTTTTAALPSTMRLGFQFDLNIGSAEGSSLLAFNRSLPELAGKRLTLSFEPATEADRQVIESYLPEVPASGEIDPSTLPTSLPAYLINLKAELKLDGEVVAQSEPVTMGDELASTTRISRLSGGWHQAVNYPIAGEFYAFGIDGQGISAPQLQAVKLTLSGYYRLRN